MKPEQDTDGRWMVPDELNVVRHFTSLPAARGWIEERSKGVSVPSS
jgi:hypothetical protein